MSAPFQAIATGLQALKQAGEIVKYIRSAEHSFEKAEIKMKVADLADALADARMSILDAQAEIERLNDAYGSRYTGFAMVPLPATIPFAGPINVDWSEFVLGSVPIESIRVASPENLFRAFLAGKYRDHGQVEEIFVHPVTAGNAAN